MAGQATAFVKMATKQKAGSKSESKASVGKRPLSGYMLFCQAKRPEVTRDNPQLLAKEVLKELGALWRALGATEKGKYQAQAKEAMTRYHSLQEEVKEEEAKPAKGGKKRAESEEAKGKRSGSEEPKGKGRAQPEEAKAKRGRKKC